MTYTWLAPSREYVGNLDYEPRFSPKTPLNLGSPNTNQKKYLKSIHNACEKKKKREETRCTV